VARAAGTGSVPEVVDGTVEAGVVDGTGGDGVMVAVPPGTVVAGACARAGVG
jgi:hypothetical protein